MGKGILVAVLTVVAVVAADQHFNFGYYTDGTITMLRQIQHSFGW